MAAPWRRVAGCRQRRLLAVLSLCWVAVCDTAAQPIGTPRRASKPSAGSKYFDVREQRRIEAEEDAFLLPPAARSEGSASRARRGHLSDTSSLKATGFGRLRKATPGEKLDAALEGLDKATDGIFGGSDYTPGKIREPEEEAETVKEEKEPIPSAKPKAESAQEKDAPAKTEPKTASSETESAKPEKDSESEESPGILEKIKAATGGIFGDDDAKPSKEKAAAPADHATPAAPTPDEPESKPAKEPAPVPTEAPVAPTPAEAAPAKAEAAKAAAPEKAPPAKVKPWDNGFKSPPVGADTNPFGKEEYNKDFVPPGIEEGITKHRESGKEVPEDWEVVKKKDVEAPPASTDTKAAEPLADGGKVVDRLHDELGPAPVAPVPGAETPPETPPPPPAAPAEAAKKEQWSSPGQTGLPSRGGARQAQPIFFSLFMVCALLCFCTGACIFCCMSRRSAIPTEDEMRMVLDSIKSRSTKEILGEKAYGTPTPVSLLRLRFLIRKAKNDQKEAVLAKKDEMFFAKKKEMMKEFKEKTKDMTKEEEKIATEAFCEEIQAERIVARNEAERLWREYELIDPTPSLVEAEEVYARLLAEWAKVQADLETQGPPSPTASAQAASGGGPMGFINRVFGRG